MKCLRRLWLVRKENSVLDLLGYLVSRWSGSKIPRKLVFGGKLIWVRPATPDAIVAVSSLLRGEFDSVLSYKNADDCRFIIDAGAYIGTAAIAFAERFPAARVICIEPSTENYAMLLKNIESYPRIISLNSALLGKKRHVHLYDKMAGEWGYTIIAPDTGGSSVAADFGMVSGVTIDDILRTYEAQKIDILKLDIEGAEKEVLENCEPWIEKCDVIIDELHDRFVEGCSTAYVTATSQMRHVDNLGEKHLAVRSAAA